MPSVHNQIDTCLILMAYAFCVPLYKKKTHCLLRNGMLYTT